MQEAQRKNPMQPPNDDIIDLATLAQKPVNYECEYCEVQLFPYPKAQIDNPYAGPSFICPKCGTITDSSYTGMRAQVQVEPVDVGDSTADNVIETIPEDRGLSFDAKEYDPEPNEEEHIKAMGGKIIDKKITASRDY